MSSPHVREMVETAHALALEEAFDLILCSCCLYIPRTQTVHVPAGLQVSEPVCAAIVVTHPSHITVSGFSYVREEQPYQSTKGERALYHSRKEHDIYNMLGLVLFHYCLLTLCST